MSNEMTSLALSKDKWLSIKSNEPMSIDELNSQLLVLQTAFPATVRNYDEFEFKALQSLWYDIFKYVPPEIMREAIRRFIIKDRKGFFPSPGMIVEYIEEIADEQKFNKLFASSDRYIKRIADGKVCDNCEYCVCDNLVFTCCNARSPKYQAELNRLGYCEFIKLKEVI